MSPSSLWTLLRLLGILPLCPSPILSASRLAHRQVYKRTYAKSSFARECLGEFCQYLYKCQPLFRTEDNDSTFCRPPTANQLKRYLDQIPEDFEMSFKVWEKITIPKYANHLRYGIRAGQEGDFSLRTNQIATIRVTPSGDGSFSLVLKV